MAQTPATLRDLCRISRDNGGSLCRELKVEARSAEGTRRYLSSARATLVHVLSDIEPQMKLFTRLSVMPISTARKRSANIEHSGLCVSMHSVALMASRTPSLWEA